MLRYKHPLSSRLHFPTSPTTKFLKRIVSTQSLISLSFVNPFSQVFYLHWNETLFSLSYLTFNLSSFYFSASCQLTIHWYLSHFVNLYSRTPVSPKCTNHSLADPSQSHWWVFFIYLAFEIWNPLWFSPGTFSVSYLQPFPWCYHLVSWQ